MGHSNLISLDASTKKLIQTLATRKSELLHKKTTKKPDGKLQMDDWDIHCMAEWWLVAAGVYLDQVQAQLLAADSPFHHTTHNNPIYD
jgi:hypothetical protein